MKKLRINVIFNTKFFIKEINRVSALMEYNFIEKENKEVSKNMVPRDGIEPPTRGFSVLCSTN